MYGKKLVAGLAIGALAITAGLYAQGGVDSQGPPEPRGLVVV
jgi:hypothetical protein